MEKRLVVSDKLSIIIMLVIIIILSALLFVFKPNYVEKQTNNILSVDADKYILTIGNRLPISDYAAATLDVKNIDSDIMDEIKFSVSSLSDKVISFEIYVADEMNNNYIDSDYIKILLTDAAGNNYNVNDGIVPVFSSLPGSARFPGNRKVYYDTIRPGHIKQYIIKMWVSDEYLIDSENKIFSTKLVIKPI